MCKKSPVFIKKNANYACYAFFGLYPCFVPKFSNFANYAGTVFSTKKLSKKGQLYTCYFKILRFPPFLIPSVFFATCTQIFFSHFPPALFTFSFIKR